MKSDVIAVILAVLIFSVWFATISTVHPRVIKYDCRLAEISPDFPPAVKEQCHKLMERK